MIPRKTVEEVKQKFESERGREIIEIVELKDTVNDRQEFYILEWLDYLGTYGYRKIWHFLTSEQPLGIGDGGYPQYNDKKKDRGIALDLYWKDVEAFKEEGRLIE